MSPELEEFLRHTPQLRQNLTKVFPPEVVNYIVDLVVKDMSHRNLIKMVEETD